MFIIVGVVGSASGCGLTLNTAPPTLSLNLEPNITVRFTF